MSDKGVEIVQSIGAIARTGLVFEKVESNKLVLRMPLEGNANHNGILYAGSLFSLAECAAGVLFLNRYGDDVIAPICASMDIRFRRPATSDVSLTLTICDEEFDKLEAQVVGEQGKRVRQCMVAGLYRHLGEQVCRGAIFFHVVVTGGPETAQGQGCIGITPVIQHREEILER